MWVLIVLTAMGPLPVSAFTLDAPEEAPVIETLTLHPEVPAIDTEPIAPESIEPLVLPAEPPAVEEQSFVEEPAVIETFSLEAPLLPEPITETVEVLPIDTYDILGEEYLPPVENTEPLLELPEEETIPEYIVPTVLEEAPTEPVSETIEVLETDPSLFEQITETVVETTESIVDVITNSLFPTELEPELPLTQQAETLLQGTSFDIVDATMDIGQSPDGNTMYKLYRAPRLLYQDSTEGFKKRPADWHLFAHHPSLSLKPSVHGEPYSYAVPLGKGMVKVRQGSMQVGLEELAPTNKDVRQINLPEQVETTYVESYPFVDVRMQDATWTRYKDITLTQQPTLNKGEDVVFWETYTFSEGIIAQTGGEQVEKEVRTSNSISFTNAHTGETFQIDPAAVYDAASERDPEVGMVLEPEPLEYIVVPDYAAHTVRVGTIVPYDYLYAEKRAYPVVVDPGYIICQEPDEFQPIPGIQLLPDCTVIDRTFKELEVAQPNRNFLFSGRFNGVDYVSALKFDISRLPANMDVDLATLHLYVSHHSWPEGERRFFDVRRIERHWDENDEYRQIRGFLADEPSHDNYGVWGNHEAQDLVFDMTGAVSDWYEDGIANHGVTVQPSPPWTAAGNPAWQEGRSVFYASEHPLGHNPYLFVSLRQPPQEEYDLNMRQISIDGDINFVELEPGEEFELRTQIRNQGNAATPNYTIGYYWSENNQLDANDVRLTTHNAVGTAPGAIDTVNKTLRVPQDANPNDRYFLFAVADIFDQVDETDENDNEDDIPVDVQEPPVDPNDPEPNNTWQTATVLPPLGNYVNNSLTLTREDQDWFRFSYNNENYYFMVRGFDGSVEGPYTLDVSLSGRTLDIETIERNGTRIDTMIFLYDTDGVTQLDSDDDGGANFFSHLIYTFPLGDLCGGQCGGGGGEPPPESEDLPDFDGDSFANIEEAIAGTPIENAQQSVSIFDVNSAQSLTKETDVRDNNYGGDPVNLRTGAFEFVQRDFTLEGRGIPIDFVRVYNSKVTDKDSRMGNGWHFSHNVFYYQDPGTQNIQVYMGGSLSSIFTTPDNGQTFVGPKGDTGTLFWDNGVLVYRTLEGVRYEFTNQITSQMGMIDRIVDTNGNTTQFTYMHRNELPLLTHITDPSGRQVELQYGAEGTADWNRIVRLHEVDDHAQRRIILYTYDEHGNLTRVRDFRTSADQNVVITKNYAYTDIDPNPDVQQFVLSEYTSPRLTKLINQYDSQGRVIRQREHNPDQDGPNDSRLIWQIAYQLGRAEAPGSVACTELITDRGGNHGSFVDVSCYDANDLKIYERDGQGNESFWTYDGQGMPASYTDPNGRVTTYTYDDRRRLTREIIPDTWWHTEYDYDYENTFNRLIRKTERTRPANDPNAEEIVRRMVRAYDQSNGNITEERYADALGNVVDRFRYDEHGNVNWHYDRNDQLTTYQYDAGGNYRTREERTVVQADGSNKQVVKQYAHDVFGNITQYIDPSGAQFTYTYDSHNNLLSETNPAGDTKNYTYDHDENRIQEVNERGFVTNYAYDRDIEGSLIRMERQGAQGQDPLVTLYGRDDIGNLTQEVDPRGNATVYTYDDANRVLMKQTPHNTITYSYDNVGNVVSETNSLNQTINYEYDTRNNRTRVRQQTAAGQANTVTTYDGFNRPVIVRDPNGNDTTYTFDYIDRPLTITDELENVTQYQYDVLVNRTRTRVTSPRGNRTATFYDGDGNVIIEINEDGKETLSFYDTRGNRIRTVDRQDDDGGNATRETTYTYDNLSRVETMTNALGGVTRYAYDAVGNQTRITDPQNRVTQYAYDAWNRQTNMTDPAGHVTGYAYDENDNLLTTQYPDNTSRTQVFDESNRRTSVTNGQGQTTQFEYDAVGNLTRRVDARNHATAFEYDAANRLVEETNQQGTITTYAYDRAGNRTAHAFDGETTQFAYDEVHRLTLQTNPGNKTEAFTYDADGNVLTQTDGEGTVTTYTYDVLGRPEQKQVGGAEYVVIYTYDNWDNSTQITEPALTRSYTFDVENNPRQETHTFADNQQAQKTVTRVYNNASEMTSLTDAAGRVFTYAYDNRGLLDTVSYNQQTLADYAYNAKGEQIEVLHANGVRTEYNYDDTSRITDVHVLHGADTYVRQQYSYDGVGNRTSMTETYVDEHGDVQSRIINYSYDTLDQLTTVNYTDRGAGNNLTFAYDAKGNRTSATGPMGSTAYAYNAAGELTGVTYNERLHIASTYDQNGSLTQEQVQRLGNDITTIGYTWDAHNRLSEIRYTDTTRPNFMPALEENVLAFAYNDEGNRVKKHANNDVTYYINSGLSVLNELDGNLAVQKTLVQGSAPIAEVDADGTIQYVHTDVLGSTVALTNEAGGLTAEYEYDVFGSLLGMKGSADTDYLFTGQEYDGESDLYYYNARYYNPRLGRFISRDTYLGEEGDSLTRNRYIYVSNNPLKFVDPTGNGKEIFSLATVLDSVSNFAKKSAKKVSEFGDFVSQYDKSPFGQSILDISSPIKGPARELIIGSPSDLVHGFGSALGDLGTVTDRNATWSQRGFASLMLGVEFGTKGKGKIIRRLPQGVGSDQFSNVSQMIREKVKDISDDVFVHGSRAKGTARVDSDIDFGIRVPADKFDELIEQRLKTLTPGSRKYNDLNIEARKQERIFGGDYHLRGFKKQVGEALGGIDADISIIKKGGLFDTGPFIPLK